LKSDGIEDDSRERKHDEQRRNSEEDEGVKVPKADHRQLDLFTWPWRRGKPLYNLRLRFEMMALVATLPIAVLE
jgi:hypothetical protein